jgi:flagellar L-ring protein precursor FlgH
MKQAMATTPTPYAATGPLTPTAVRVALTAVCAISMGGCVAPYESIVPTPTIVRPMPQANYVERINNGSIYNVNASGWLFQDDKRPTSIGDIVKVDIGESLSATTKVTSTTSRENKVGVKGPGDGTDHRGLTNNIVNIDANANGNDSFKGSGKSENTSDFKGRIAASVINVLPNGYLLIAGEKKIAFNGDVSSLRFSGVVNPKDIKPGSVVSSADIVNARLEQAGKGDISDTASRNWIQRVLTSTLTMW